MTILTKTTEVILFLSHANHDLISRQYHNLAARLVKEFQTRDVGLYGVTYKGITQNLKDTIKETIEKHTLK